ncbi:ABC transporter ATP-binding protein [Sphingomonas sp. 28-62-20]|uniref:ABC transporter ATP-binding protein n=1 Tax=Sphingomonas sp. 28-62-20 TaxID=1970433 RepID=UPI0035A9AB81
MFDPLIETVAVTKIYDLGGNRVVAVDSVSIKIDRGDHVAIMGPSGSGKSTFMNLLGCLDRPTHGALIVDGADVTQFTIDQLASFRSRTIGFVFQQFNLMARMNAVDNVALPLIYQGVPAPERRERARDALAAMALDDRFDHLPAQMSGGQQQRVAIARALVGNPRLILADEPTGALDSETSRDVLDRLDGLQARGITLVTVTHDPRVADRARRIVDFFDGRVVSDNARRALETSAAEQDARAATP